MTADGVWKKTRSRDRRFVARAARASDTHSSYQSSRDVMKSSGIKQQLKQEAAIGTEPDPPTTIGHRTQKLPPTPVLMGTDRFDKIVCKLSEKRSSCTLLWEQKAASKVSKFSFSSTIARYGAKVCILSSHQKCRAEVFTAGLHPINVKHLRHPHRMRPPATLSRETKRKMNGRVRFLNHELELLAMAQLCICSNTLGQH